MSRTTAAVLTEARRQIKKRGWAQGQGVDAEGHICAAQAIGMNSGSNEVAMATWALMIEIRERTRLPYDSIPMWNDAPGRTIEEVLATFDGAILRSTEERIEVNVHLGWTSGYATPVVVIDAPITAKVSKCEEKKELMPV